jgi:hypothetical protein
MRLLVLLGLAAGLSAGLYAAWFFWDGNGIRAAIFVAAGGAIGWLACHYATRRRPG